jgi:hypothetical protein
MRHFWLYVDPGSGSYLVQMIIAGILGALFYFRNIWFRVKTFFGWKKKQSESEQDQSHE